MPKLDITVTLNVKVKRARLYFGMLLLRLANYLIESAIVATIADTGTGGKLGAARRKAGLTWPTPPSPPPNRPFKKGA